MQRGGATLAVSAGLAALALAGPAAAHPMPFSTLDLRIDGASVEVSLTAHTFDWAHDLGLQPPERLLDPKAAAAQAGAVTALMGPRMKLAADGRWLPVSWSGPEVVVDRQALRLHRRHLLPDPPAHLQIEAVLFPYDRNHQTFVNVYERGALVTQAIVDAQHPTFQHFPGTAAGRLAVVRKFVGAGVHHILIGFDHIAFLVGLLLLGGRFRRLVLVVSAFTAGHSVTLTLAALGVVDLPARIVEPAIALSIVLVGADNLLARPGGRDARPLYALGFGLVHGFGFASVLRDTGLPAGALGWSLFSFNLGVEIGQLLVVAVVSVALASLRARSEQIGRRLTLAGSVAVAAAGAFWFIERVFFSGGIS
jgi:hydrogenase/urease accessory protein HupE